MALVKCPECGKEISDKAVNCPNCGCPKNDNISIEVEEKGQITENGFRESNHTKISKGNKKRKILIGSIVAIVLVIVIAIIVVVLNNHFKEKELIASLDEAAYEDILESLDNLDECVNELIYVEEEIENSSLTVQMKKKKDAASLKVLYACENISDILQKDCLSDENREDIKSYIKIGFNEQDLEKIEEIINRLIREEWKKEYLLELFELQ